VATDDENRRRLHAAHPDVIERAELVRIIDAASEGCTESTRVKLHAVAETTDAVAVGWFHCCGYLCPAMQASRRNQRFQEAFDLAMSTRFRRTATRSQFVVRVVAVAGREQ
jgi:hypothetical protein